MLAPNRCNLGGGSVWEALEKLCNLKKRNPSPGKVIGMEILVDVMEMSCNFKLKLSENKHADDTFIDFCIN